MTLILLVSHPVSFSIQLFSLLWASGCIVPKHNWSHFMPGSKCVDQHAKQTWKCCILETLLVLLCILSII